MLKFETHVLTKVALLASMIIFASSQLVSASPTSTELLKQAQALLKKNQNGAAVDCLNKLIRKDPSSDAYYWRSEAYGQLGQYQRQIDDLTSAIKADPKDAILYESRAIAYYKLWQLGKSIEDCYTESSLNPSSVFAHSNAAWAYEELGQYDKAIELRTKAFELKTPDADDWNRRAIDYELLNKYDLAQADWQKAIKIGNPSKLAEIQLTSPLIDFNDPSGESPKNKIDKQLESNSVVLPFHYDATGHIGVPVILNGHSLQFMLDTGSEETALWKQAQPAVAPINNVQLHSTQANGNRYSFGWFRVQELKLDNLSLPNVAMAVVEGLVGHKTLSGFLGGNILENFVVTIDYTKKQVILARGYNQDSSKEAIIVPMRIRSHRPYCTVNLDGKLKVMALLDTGCAGDLSADSLLKPILNSKLTFWDYTSGPWLGSLKMQKVMLKSIELGGINFKEPIFQVFRASEAPVLACNIILGNSFLSGFKRVTFDYPARKVIFEPAKNVSESAQSLYEQGMFRLLNGSDVQQAEDTFSRSIILDKDLATRCYFRLSVIFVNLKQYRKALENITATIKLDPKDPANYCYRAEIYNKLGQYWLEIADYTRAINVDNKYSLAYLNRAEVYAKLGKHQLAKRDRQMAKSFSR